MSAVTPPVSQTRAFSTIFLIELWERFGYYGMAAILVLFMVEKIGFDDSKANLIWGAFTGLVYVLGMVVICFAPDTSRNRLED